MKAGQRRFDGPLAAQFHAFLDYRRDLPTWHAHVEVALGHFDRFLCTYVSTAPSVTEPRLRAWKATLSNRAPITRRNYFRVVRQFCIFRARAERTVFVPDRLSCPRVVERFRPYIYSEARFERCWPQRPASGAASGLTPTSPSSSSSTRPGAQSRRRCDVLPFL